MSKEPRDYATEALQYFELKTRKTDQFYCLKDGRPDWVQELVYSAHDGMLPDDFRYEIIHDCLEAISNEEQDCLEPESRNHVLIDWLGSYGYRPDYCNEAMADYLEYNGDLDIMSIIQAGYRLEQSEVMALIESYLNDLTEE